MASHNHYLKRLYPLQDSFLHFFNEVHSGNFYLTGGTALSRFYFKHRYSDDLDFFSTKHLKEFRQIVTKIIRGAEHQGFSSEAETLSDTFVRVFVKKGKLPLKIDFVNEPVYHWGKFKRFSLFGRVDNPLNILANKITCISRHEVKDMADIWIIAKRLSFSWRRIMGAANLKSPVDPVETSKIINSLPREELKHVKWAMDVDITDIHAELKTISEDILRGRTNSLKRKLGRG